MRSFALLPLIVSAAYALPQEACSTITKQVIVPTRTATYSSTAIVTIRPSTAKDLGTFTWVTTISDTTTLQTLTTTTGVCGETGTVTVPAATVTEYGGGGDGDDKLKRELGLNPRDAVCTLTVTSYTTHGQTYTYVPAGRTRTFYDYSEFSQATVTSFKTGGKAYAIATDGATTKTTCGSSTVTAVGETATVSLDAKCSPAAMTSAYNGYGISYLSDTPLAGATYQTNTTDASACCQACATSWQCAASAWDIRTGECRLEFPVQWDTGVLNCGQGLLAYYDAGPDSPMSAGTGWYVAELCGKAIYGNTKPDDGS